MAVLPAVLVGAAATAQPGPHIGYVYPAGGQRGTTFRVAVGGQSLQNPEGVYVSGEGVRATVVEYVRPLNDAELGDAWRCLYQLVRRQWSARVMEAAAQEDAGEPPLPDHPWLRGLDRSSAAEVGELRTRLFDPKKQPNAQIAEQVELEITIDAEAAPGDRELRLATPLGLSNPMRFQVGVLPEVCEADLLIPGDFETRVLELPTLVNGQITPGDVDRFRLKARQGQRLVIRLDARRLIPYLADAVPGWFQATLTLRDPSGSEVAYDDDFRFDPDPVLLYDVPADGVYGLEVHDAIYRGRDDFVYRIAVGELPFVTEMFPLGGQAGAATEAEVRGWNLPQNALSLDTTPGGPALRYASLGGEQGLCAEAPYAVGALPEALEVEPNDAPAAQDVVLPLTVNGRIDRPGDVDAFRFTGRADEEIVAEILARRLHSPLDSALRVFDATGAVVGLNDDHPDPETGLVTHQADSYLRVKLPQDGTYLVYVSDTQRQGGEAFAYRLRLGPPQPDFSVRVTPSTVNVAPGGSTPLTFRAVRRDGFAGDIDVALTDAPPGFTLSQWHIPADKESVEATLTAPRGAARQTFPLQLAARGEIDGVAVARTVAPSEDMMQAFLYRHLVPQEELLVTVTGARPVPAVWRPRVPGITLAEAARVQVPLGGRAQVQVQAPGMLPDRRQTPLDRVQFVASARPRGVTLEQTTLGPNGLILTLQADPYIARVGDAGHVIVEAFTDVPTGVSDKGTPARLRRVSLGVLPAIPVETVRP